MAGALSMRRCLALLLLVLGAALLAPGLPVAQGAGAALVLRMDGAIGPASSDYLGKGLARAAVAGTQVVVIELDTPGGLDTSMRAIVKNILASPVPVVTFVAPEGARAASAGTFILYASHVAAMAPATNLGAATPVAIGTGGPAPGRSTPLDKPATTPDSAPADDEQGATADETRKPQSAAPSPDAMAAKSVSDASAYIRGLAQLRGRNVEFAERAVREAASLSAEEALSAGVIDLIALDTADLLAKLDGREVALLDGKRTLRTAGIQVERVEPDWRNRVLAAIANPQVALFLMMIGIYGLFFEFTSPGFGVPGVAGAIALLVALYAFHLLPVNWAGVLLVAVGAALMLAEAFLPSFGVLGVGGIIAFVVGGLFLIDTDVPGFGLPIALLVGMALTSAAIIMAIGSFAARSLRRPVVSGSEELCGSTGTVSCAAGDGTWWVRVHGETWRARSAEALTPGQPVRVDRLDGLMLEVSPTGASPHDGSTRQ